MQWRIPSYLPRTTRARAEAPPGGGGPKLGSPEGLRNGGEATKGCIAVLHGPHLEPNYLWLLRGLRDPMRSRGLMHQ